jgi:ribosomal protein S20
MATGNKGGTSIIGPALQVGGGLLGMINQRKRENRLFNRQKQLMGLQFDQQQKLNQQGADLAYENWLRTNFPAQVEQLKEAGLSVGMMYGQGGAGGATANAGSGGGAAGGSPIDPSFLDIGSIMQAAKIGEELEALKATKDKTKAEAKSIELDNVVKERIGQEADILEASNRRDAAIQKGQFLFENAEPDTRFEEREKAELEKAQIDVEVQKLLKKGILSDNEVKAYKARLAKAEIDPDSNPLIRELMKAMANAGVPLNKLLERAVRIFIKQ